MSKSADKSSAKERTVIAIIIGVLSGIIVFSIGTLVLSGVMCSSDEVPAAIYYIQYAVCAISALVCGFVAARKGKGKGIVLGLISGIPLSAIIILPLWAVFGAEASFNLLFILPVVLLFSVTGGVISVNIR